MTQNIKHMVTLLHNCLMLLKNVTWFQNKDMVKILHTKLNCTNNIQEFFSWWTIEHFNMSPWKFYFNCPFFLKPHYILTHLRNMTQISAWPKPLSENDTAISMTKPLLRNMLILFLLPTLHKTRTSLNCLNRNNYIIYVQLELTPSRFKF